MFSSEKVGHGARGSWWDQLAETPQDHLRQTINCPIDTEFADNFIAFDGSNKLYRMRGELAADCHRENINILTLNHDVITGEKTVDEARQAFAENAIKAEMGMELSTPRTYSSTFRRVTKATLMSRSSLTR